MRPNVRIDCGAVALQSSFHLLNVFQRLRLDLPPMLQLLTDPDKFLLSLLNLLLVVAMPGRITQGREELRLPHIFTHCNVGIALDDHIEEKVLGENADLTPLCWRGSIDEELDKDASRSPANLRGFGFSDGRAVFMFNKREVGGIRGISNDLRGSLRFPVFMFLSAPEVDAWAVFFAKDEALEWFSGTRNANFAIVILRDFSWCRPTLHQCLKSPPTDS